jgi:hypothetical protein
MLQCYWICREVRSVVVKNTLLVYIVISVWHVSAVDVGHLHVIHTQELSLEQFQLRKEVMAASQRIRSTDGKRRMSLVQADALL